MRIIRILGILAAGMLLMASCSEETVIEETSANPTEGQEGVVRFALGGAAGSATKTRAEETTIEAESDEKAVESLYAVVFKDADTTGDTEDDADLFFKVITPEVSDESNELVREFSIGTGNYQICFVANPSEDLLGGIEGLTAGSSNVANFKKLVEKKSPDTKPGMLMTSSFHKVSVETNKENDLGTVTLERAMARIDIVNLADGITIDSVKFVNRATRSVLISDAVTTEYAAFRDTAYKDMNLAGSSGGSAAYEAEIYSYEQYGTEGSAPSLKIYYSIGEDDYSHTIEFKDNDGNQINLKRNHIYTVNISNAQGKLTFTLTVADWNVGTVMDVTSDELLRGIEYGNAKVGDIMLSDGTLVRLEDEETLTDDQKAKAIGVVAYLYTDADRSTKAGSYGLVMAMKNASEKVRWITFASYVIARKDETVGAAYNYSCNGYEFLQKLDEFYKEKMQNLMVKENFLKGYCPPFYAALYTYPVTVAVPDWTTGWYVPSVREWTDMLGALGYLTVTEVAGSTNDTYTNTGGATIFDKVNSYMSKMGDDYYDPFASGNKYWTCSECSNSEANKSDAYYLEYSSSGLVIGHAYKQDVIALTRLVLGF